MNLSFYYFDNSAAIFLASSSVKSLSNSSFVIILNGLLLESNLPIDSYSSRELVVRTALSVTVCIIGFNSIYSKIIVEEFGVPAT